MPAHSLSSAIPRIDFRRGLYSPSTAHSAPQSPRNPPNPSRDCIIQMKDRIFFAREEIRHAIEVLVKLEPPNPAAIHNPDSSNGSDSSLLKLDAVHKPAPLSIPKQAELIRTILANKKMSLHEISVALSNSSRRLSTILVNETKFYGEVAVNQLRRHNWILHSKDDLRGGRGLYVDYGLRNGSNSAKLELPALYGRCESDGKGSKASKTKIQQALESAKAAAFEAELFNHVRVYIVYLCGS
ncbi:hypothetical protein HDU84_002951 [Entophlyctis sp. JEL0112]|nr:hypothetical protein HDU84_002951 [Entophlyctis sp. JEL0112]